MSDATQPRYPWWEFFIPGVLFLALSLSRAENSLPKERGRQRGQHKAWPAFLGGIEAKTRMGFFVAIREDNKSRQHFQCQQPLL